MPKNSVIVNAITDKGGVVCLNMLHGVVVSYAVATAGDLPPSEIFTAAIGTPDGRTVMFFYNRENGLVTAEVCDKDGQSGIELLRTAIV